MSYYNQQQTPVESPAARYALLRYPPEGYGKDAYPPPGYPPEGYPPQGGYPARVTLPRAPQGYPPNSTSSRSRRAATPTSSKDGKISPSLTLLAALCCCCLLDACF
ncbi:unnamed protein product [Spirodela intermedia]|uniref:Uncharacterized protein n=1 Tax=Spirodela intermedia TaxID=51605 RepID=A0A7I8I916_SPIIN|nr:unnamed protein product [Spirodela intermedia]CAA6653562.1 unnamed protein product [Spirodela intermedia]